MTEEKDMTVGQFVSESKQTPDSEREAVDNENLTVVNEEDLPEAAKSPESSDSTQAESEPPVVVTGHSRGDIDQDVPDVYEAEFESGPQVFEVDFVFKRTYVDDLTEVPEGTQLQSGEQGGLYYEGSSQEFLQMMFDITVDEIENQDEYDYSEEEIQRAVQNAQEAQEIAEESFSNAVDAAQESGASIDMAQHRVKSVGSALEKVHNREETEDKYDTVDELRDWHGSMVVVDNNEQVHETMERLEENEDLVDVNDHFENTASDPYRAYNVKQEIDGVVTELQIMSDEMHSIKEVSHQMLLKPEAEAPVDEVEEVPDDYDGDHPLSDDIEDCLIQEANVLDQELDPQEVECDGRAREVITAILEHEGMT